MEIPRQLSHNKMEIKKESPDVETPGLLVKALISSFFLSRRQAPPTFLLFTRLPPYISVCLAYHNIFFLLIANIAVKKHTSK
jgi:hypothetical protein